MATLLAEKPIQITLQDEIKEKLPEQEVKLPEQEVNIMLELFDLEPDAGHDQPLKISLKLHQLEDY